MKTLTAEEILNSNHLENYNRGKYTPVVSFETAIKSMEDYHAQFHPSETKVSDERIVSKALGLHSRLSNDPTYYPKDFCNDLSLLFSSKEVKCGFEKWLSEKISDMDAMTKKTPRELGLYAGFTCVLSEYQKFPSKEERIKELSNFLLWYKSSHNTFIECKNDYIVEEYLKTLIK